MTIHVNYTASQLLSPFRPCPNDSCYNAASLLRPSPSPCSNATSLLCPSPSPRPNAASLLRPSTSPSPSPFRPCPNAASLLCPSPSPFRPCPNARCSNATSLLPLSCHNAIRFSLCPITNASASARMFSLCPDRRFSLCPDRRFSLCPDRSFSLCPDRSFSLCPDRSFSLCSIINARRLLLCPNASARMFSLTQKQKLLTIANAMRVHTGTNCFFINPKPKIVLSKSYALFSLKRGLSGRSYDLQFDHKITFYSLEKMISEGKLHYDYPVYWKKSDDTVSKILTRKDKKDKVLKDFLDKYAKLFNSIMNSPKDYKFYMYFCEHRIKLNFYISAQMGLNYESRFLYCEKIFLKFERNLFCLNILNVDQFDLELKKYKVLCNDYHNYIVRFNNVFQLIGIDFRKYSYLIGDTTYTNNIAKSVRSLVKRKYVTKIKASQNYLEKMLIKLIKECDKRKAAPAEDQTNDSIFLRDMFSDPQPTGSHFASTDLPKSVSLPSTTGQASAEGSSSVPNPYADNLIPPSSTQSNPPDSRSTVPSSTQSNPPDSVEGRKAQDPHFFSAIAPPLFSNLSDPSMPLNPHFPSFSGLHKLFNDVTNIRLISQVFTLLLVILSTMGLSFSSFNVNEYLLRDYKEIVTLWPNSLITLSLVAALAITYAFNSRKMPVMVQLLFQVLITFLLIYVIFHFFTNTTSSEIPELIDKINPPADPTDNEKINPTDPAYKSDGALPVNPTDSASESDGPAWYYSKKVWGCILIAGLAAVVYYLKGFAPASSDDMETFRSVVSKGVDNVASSQVSLSQTLSERVNSAAFRADILNSTSEEMLSDIVAAGNAARLQLEQMGEVGQEFNQLHSRVDTINDKMTILLKGIVYLISLKWVFFSSSPASGSEVVNETPASGSEIVNEVLSNSRPFSFSSTATVEAAAAQTEALATYEISTQTDEATVAAAVVQTDKATVAAAVAQTDESTVAAAVTQTEALSTATQTDEMFMDRAYTVLRPAIDSIGEPSLLAKLRQLVRIISEALTSSDDDDEFEEAVTNISVTSRDTNISIASRDTVYSIAIDTELPSIIEGERSSGSTPTRSPVTELPSTSRNPFSGGLESPAEALDGDIFRVVDNPIYRPTSLLDTGSLSEASASPLNDQDQNPYQFHRHQLYHVKRVFLYLCELLEQM